MLKKIIKTHTTRLGVVDIIKPTFLRNAVATNRQRRVIASRKNIESKIVTRSVCLSVCPVIRSAMR